MKLTLQLQLLPDEAQVVDLRRTVERFNAAANWLAGLAFKAQTASKYELQKRHYYELRERFDLPADMTIRVIAQVCEAYKRDKTKKPTFRKHAAVPYSHGKNYGFKGVDRVSISVVPSGRAIVPFVLGKYQKERFGFAKGQADLVLREDGKWFFLVTVDLPGDPEIAATEFIGVDLGIEQIAVTSDGDAYEDKQVQDARRKLAERRKKLGRAAGGRQRRGKRPRNIRRVIKRTKRREGRFRRDVNHVISKKIVQAAKRTGRGIGLEDLKYIRARVRLRRRQRDRFYGWAFGQLRTFIEYKGRLAGVPVVTVDARHTSQTCSECGHCERSNRKNQSQFICRRCGFAANADSNAALNIKARAEVNRPMVSGHLDLGTSRLSFG